METKMRAEGTYKEYERNKIEANMKSYLRDAKQQSEEYLKSLEQIEILQNSQGDIEK
ncbi:MAG: hypothetical protein H8E13_12335 [Actinobacteria bacterium]|nr:hypothetical protein [Actinomycetota bacterium]